MTAHNVHKPVQLQAYNVCAVFYDDWFRQAMCKREAAKDK